MELRLATCRLRDWRASDADAVARHANDRDVWRNLRDRFPHPYRPSDFHDWMRHVADDRSELSLAIEADGEAVGGIGLVLGTDVHRRTAEIGYWVGRAVWNRGIATEAVRAITAWGFEAFDLARIHAFVFAWNPASGRVLEKAGYALEGRMRNYVTKDGETLDALLYAAVPPGGSGPS